MSDYSITLPDTDQPKVYAILTKATEFADKFAAKNSVELEVVHTSTGVVAHVATPVKGRHFFPWERVETPKFPAPHFEGWRPAYTRKRITATVYRSYDPEAELPWMVHDGRSGNTKLVATTKAANEVTKGMKDREL